MITITEAARKKFIEVRDSEGKADYDLRVIVRNGGSHRPEFALNFVAPDESPADDTVVDAGDFAIRIDAESVKWLKDASVDFVNAMHESGFKVDAPNAGVPKPSGPLAEALERILIEKINPAVASHGGHVSLVAVEEGTAYLRFGGGCQGCGMVNVTLKQGVERVIFESVPQITKVMDITDHAAGTNPYYQPSK